MFALAFLNSGKIRMIVLLTDYELLESEAVGGVLDEHKYLDCICIWKILGQATLQNQSKLFQSVVQDQQHHLSEVQILNPGSD